MRWEREVLTLLSASGRPDQSHRLAPDSTTPNLRPTKPKGKGGRAKTKPHTPERERDHMSLRGDMCEENRRYLLYRLGLAGGTSTMSGNIEAEWKSGRVGHRMRCTYFPKRELKFSHPENMSRSFFLDGWSDRAMRWEREVLTLLSASGRPDQSHRLAPML